MKISKPVCDINCRMCHDAMQQIHDIAEAYLKEHEYKKGYIKR